MHSKEKMKPRRIAEKKIKIPASEVASALVLVMKSLCLPVQEMYIRIKLLQQKLGVK